jgi:hypothetical protein
VALAADFPVKYSVNSPIMPSAESQAYMKSHAGEALMPDPIIMRLAFHIAIFLI